MKKKSVKVSDTGEKLLKELSMPIMNPMRVDFGLDDQELHELLESGPKMISWEKVLPKQKMRLEKARAVAKDAEFGRREHERRIIFGKRGANATKNTANAYRRNWLSLAKTIQEKHKLWTVHRIAIEVHNKLNPEQSRQTVYKYLLKHLVKPINNMK